MIMVPFNERMLATSTSGPLSRLKCANVKIKRVFYYRFKVEKKKGGRKIKLALSLILSNV